MNKLAAALLALGLLSNCTPSYAGDWDTCERLAGGPLSDFFDTANCASQLQEGRFEASLDWNAKPDHSAQDQDPALDLDHSYLPDQDN